MSRSLFLASLATVLALTTTVRANSITTIYEASFAHSGGDVSLHGTTDWTGVWLEAGSLESFEQYTSGHSNSEAPDISGNQGGYIFFNYSSETVGDDPVLLFIEEDPGASRTFGAAGLLEAMSVATRNSDNDEDLRFALRIGTDWFVSDPVINNPGPGSFATTSVDVDAITWNSLTVDATTLSMGGATTLPGGTVTAVGLFDQAQDNDWRIRDFQVTGIIPEPATSALLAVGGTLIFASRRRRP